MSRKPVTVRDLRKAPVYSIAEAAGYLRLPKSTLRTWLLGQGSYQSEIEIADRQGRRLSFTNLIEAIVLARNRRKHTDYMYKRAQDRGLRVLRLKRRIRKDRAFPGGT